MSSFLIIDELFRQVAATLSGRHPFQGHTSLLRSCEGKTTHKRDEVKGADADIEPWVLDTDPWELAELMVRDWQHANVMAVHARYPDTAEEYWKLDLTTAKNMKGGKAMSLIECYKAVMCIHYQCCEDVHPEHQGRHDELLAEMVAVRHHLSSVIVEHTPEFNAAPWGKPIEREVLEVVTASSSSYTFRIG